MAGSSYSASRENKRGDHTSIKIEDAYKQAMVSINKKLVQVSPPHSDCCIYRVPKNLRIVNEKAYTPQIVSIGPFHRDNQNLKAMENHKVLYMHDLLKRRPESEKNFDNCSRAIWELKEKISSSYEGTQVFSDTEFLEMMLLDGCFILELFLKCSIFPVLIDKNDPIFNTAWMAKTIVRDLLLLENQIPFTILESLYDQLAVTSTSCSIVELTLYFFQSTLCIDWSLLKLKGERQSHKHLLDLLHNCYLPSLPENISKGIGEWESLRCATELNRAGIHFKRAVKSSNLFDMSFGNGVLVIPPLVIGEWTECLFRNFIALEQCSHGIRHHIISYAAFMDLLINSKEDVELLQEKRIIRNYLGSEEDVSFLFNNLCKEVIIKNFYFRDVCAAMEAYYKTRWRTWKAIHWHKWKTILKHEYFNSPWAVLKFIAAVVLLILTFIQTLISVLPYVHH